MKDGYVNENRIADRSESDAIAKALEGFGENPGKYSYFLYGRYDAPYGWYLFGISPAEGQPDGERFADGQVEKYLLLGDCLDVLPDFNGLVGLDKVHRFALEDPDRYRALHDWGAIGGISDGMKTAVCGVPGTVIRSETMAWDGDGGRWNIIYAVSFVTEDCKTEEYLLKVPSAIQSYPDADAMFCRLCNGILELDLSDGGRAKWGDICAAVDRYRMEGNTQEEFTCEVSNRESQYIEPADDMSGESVGDRVYALVIREDCADAPELYRTFDSAVNAVRERLCEEQKGRWEEIRTEFEKNRHWCDGKHDVEYYIDELAVHP